MIPRNAGEGPAGRGQTVRTVGWLASSSLLGTVLGIAGSLVQAHFITPLDLGFVRKYSVVAGYAGFLSLGLFIILQREYPVLMGKGEPERARRTAAVVRAWSLLASWVVCGGLLVVMLVDLVRGRWREAAAWLVQIAAVWSALYAGYLTCLFRSSHAFKPLAKGQILSAVSGIAVLPGFLFWPFPTLIARSVAGSIVSSAYLHGARPVRVGWLLPGRELLSLVRRGLRLFAGDYTRYIFWLTVEIWLMLWAAGEAGVGLLVFGKLIADAASQFSVAINQVFIPRLAERYGQAESLRSCLRLSLKPTLLNLGAALPVMAAVWIVVPPVVRAAFPKYAAGIPLMRVLLFQAPIVGLSLPVYMVTVLEGYRLQIVAAAVGLGVFVGTTLVLHGRGLGAVSVAWGTLAGQSVFLAISLTWLWIRAKSE